MSKKIVRQKNQKVLLGIEQNMTQRETRGGKTMYHKTPPTTTPPTPPHPHIAFLSSSP